MSKGFDVVFSMANLDQVRRCIGHDVDKWLISRASRVVILKIYRTWSLPAIWSKLKTGRQLLGSYDILSLALRRIALWQPPKAPCRYQGRPRIGEENSDESTIEMVWIGSINHKPHGRPVFMACQRRSSYAGERLHGIPGPSDFKVEWLRVLDSRARSVAVASLSGAEHYLPWLLAVCKARLGKDWASERCKAHLKLLENTKRYKQAAET